MSDQHNYFLIFSAIDEHRVLNSVSYCLLCHMVLHRTSMQFNEVYLEDDRYFNGAVCSSEEPPCLD